MGVGCGGGRVKRGKINAMQKGVWKWAQERVKREGRCAKDHVWGVGKCGKGKQVCVGCVWGKGRCGGVGVGGGGGGEGWGKEINCQKWVKGKTNQPNQRGQRVGKGKNKGGTKGVGKGPGVCGGW